MRLGILEGGGGRPDRDDAGGDHARVPRTRHAHAAAGERAPRRSGGPVPGPGATRRSTEGRHIVAIALAPRGCDTPGDLPRACSRSHVF